MEYSSQPASVDAPLLSRQWAVITGDVIGSRGFADSVWREALHSALSDFGESPAQWDLYRGDAFQLLLAQPERALMVAMSIKAYVKCTKGLDVRMAIGLGQVHSLQARVAESNGEAFVYSGSLIDELEQWDQSLALRCADEALNMELNASLALAAAVMDKWLPNYAQAMYASLKHPHCTQVQLAKQLGMAQSTLSERHTRANRRALIRFAEYFQSRIAQWIEQGGN